MGLEVELKLQLVSSEDYVTLCARLPSFLGEQVQRNVYFDVPGGRLRQARVLLRLRVEGPRAWLTVKYAPTIEDDGLFAVPEDEEPLSTEVAARVLAGEVPLDDVDSIVLERLRAAVGNTTGLRPWGRLENVRRRYRLSPEWVVEVDRTEFPGGLVEWEVELEGADPRGGATLLSPYLEGVRWLPQRKPKSQRLVEYLSSIEGPSAGPMA
ncbi:MAG: CYTH domain-containing protein [Planctomycetota bacterium]